MSFLGFCLSSNWERESGKRNLGIKEKCPQSYLSYFRRGSTGESFFFHGLIDFVLFLILAWRIWSPSCLSQSFVFSPEWNGYGLSATSLAQKLNFFLFTSAEGKGAPLPLWGPSQSFGFSLFPLPMSGDRRSLSTNICLSPLWPTFSLNGHFLTAR